MRIAVTLIVYSILTVSVFAAEATEDARKASTDAHMKNIEAKIVELLKAKEQRQQFADSDKIVEENMTKILDLMAGRTTPASQPNTTTTTTDSSTTTPPSVDSQVAELLGKLTGVANISLAPYEPLLNEIKNQYAGKPAGKKAFFLSMKLMLDKNRRRGKPFDPIPTEKDPMDAEIEAIKAHFDKTKENRAACPVPSRSKSWRSKVSAKLIATGNTLAGLLTANNTLKGETRQKSFEVEQLDKQISNAEEKIDKRAEAKFSRAFNKLLSEILRIKPNIFKKDREETVEHEELGKIVAKLWIPEIAKRLMKNGTKGLSGLTIGTTPLTTYYQLRWKDWFADDITNIDIDEYYTVKSEKTSTTSLSGKEALEKAFETAGFLPRETVIKAMKEAGISAPNVFTGVNDDHVQFKGAVNKVALGRMSELDKLMKEWEATGIREAKEQFDTLVAKRKVIQDGIDAKNQAHQKSVDTIKSELGQLTRLLGSIDSCITKVDAMDDSIRAIPVDKLTVHGMKESSEKSQDAHDTSGRVIRRYREWNADN